MIVCKPAWTRRLKSYRTQWTRQWHEVPFVQTSRVQTAHVVSRDYEQHRYVACVYTYGVRTDLGEFKTLGEAQVACDAECSRRLVVSADEAVANWRAWTKEKRAAAKADRDRRRAENEAKLTPEARERSKRLAEALDIEPGTSRRG